MEVLVNRCLVWQPTGHELLYIGVGMVGLGGVVSMVGVAGRTGVVDMVGLVEAPCVIALPRLHSNGERVAPLHVRACTQGPLAPQPLKLQGEG